MKLPQEQTKRETAGNAAGILTALLLSICILSVAFYAWQKSVNPSITPQDLLHMLTGISTEAVKDAKLLYEFDFDSKENPVFAIYGDNIAECNSGGIRFLDKKGQSVWFENMSLNKAVLKTNGSQLLVADIGSNDIFVINGREIRWKDKLDSTILNADISEDGFVAVIAASKRYSNEIRIYDPYGNELFRKIIASDFAVNAGIAPDEKTLVVSGISAGTSRANSSYKFYDLDGNEKAVQNLTASGLLPLYWFNGDGSIFAAGDRSAAGLDSSGKIIWEKQYTAVLGAYPAGDRRFAVAAEDKTGIQLAIYDSQGEEIASEKLAIKPRRITAIKGTIAVFADDTVYFYNDRCKNTAKYSSGSQIRQIAFFNRYQAAVVSNDTVAVININ